MKLDFTKPLMNYEGKPYEDIPGKNLMMNVFLGRALGNYMTKGDDVLKYFDWATTLLRGDVLSLDRADQDKLRSFITNNEGLPTWSKGQLLEVFNDKSEKQKSATEESETKEGTPTEEVV